MNLGLGDTFTFGKYKGYKVSEVLGKDPGYCCWLREERKKAAQPNAFDAETNAAIDKAITGSRGLRKKYQPWGVTQQAGASEPEEMPEDVSDVSRRRMAAYADEWGAW